MDGPNILFFCSDQQHWWMNSFNGHPLVRTPNLQRLAEQGTNFRRCYSNSPVCVPARAALMTGRTCSELETYDNGAPFDGRVPTFANVARDQGYACTAFGKLDMTAGKDYGFVEAQAAHGHDVSPDVTAFFRNPMCFKGTGFSTPEQIVRRGPSGDRRTIDLTKCYLHDDAPRAGDPWLVWTGINAPHNPYRAPQELLDLYPEERIDVPLFPDDWRDTEHPVMAITRYHRGCTHAIPPDQVRRERRAYYAMITEIDAMVGELVETLKKTGQWENTVIVFTSDHGDMMGEHGFFHKNAPYDGCARVPLIIAGPGVPRGTVVDTPVSLVDLFPTIAELVGARVPAGVRGHSLLPLAGGDTSAHPHVLVELNTERLITGEFSIVRGDWKYNYYVDYPDQLFDLRNDPGEWVDRVRDPVCADIRRQLREVLFSLVDPDRVNDDAFADQERRLNAFIGPRTLDQVLGEASFLEHFSRRLGDEQARRLLRRHFQHRDRQGTVKN